MKNRAGFKIISIAAGILISLLILEIALRSAGFFLIPRNNHNNETGYSQAIVFSGDSWTTGCDASAGKGFFALLSLDEDLQGLPIINYGYGSNNLFQVVNSIIGRNDLPKAVIINGGINSWHLIGLKEFILNSQNYLNPDEIKELRGDFRYNFESSFLNNLKIYKLYCYLLRKNETSYDIKSLDERIASAFFWDTYISFREQYQNHALMMKALPQFIKEDKLLNLDQKFYFTAMLTEFDTGRMEAVLKEGEIFYPARLKIVSYEVYKRMDMNSPKLANTNELIIKWSLKVLSIWSRKYNVAVFVQTYPDIRKESLGNNSFEKVNDRIRVHSKMNGLEIIEHNNGGIDWTKYKTCWHVNDEGHRLMAEIIKPYFTKREIGQ